jgi:CRISPR-associated protein Cmr3
MFQYLIVVEPLGLLYGSAGGFLSPENLVGRSGASFPPSAAALSGLVAAQYAEQYPDPQDLRAAIGALKLAGPFWAKSEMPQNWYVPTPLNCLTTWQNPMPDPGEFRVGKITGLLHYSDSSWKIQQGERSGGKSDRNSWVAIADWSKLQSGAIAAVSVHENQWKFLPHLHPELQADQRHTVSGRLFLENSVQLHPEACLIYLANLEIPSGWYRFGGEGHLVNVRCEALNTATRELLDRPVDRSFALITPAVWGSNRLSYRRAPAWGKGVALLTERPSPFRYRFGGADHKKPKRLSRGRYAVPAGTVYITPTPLPAWHRWPDDWFPQEGVYLNRWGCGLALPFPIALAATASTTEPTSGVA